MGRQGAQIGEQKWLNCRVGVEHSGPRQVAGYNNILAAGGLCWCTHWISEHQPVVNTQSLGCRLCSFHQQYRGKEEEAIGKWVRNSSTRGGVGQGGEKPAGTWPGEGATSPKMGSSPPSFLILGRSAGPSSLRRWTITHIHTHTHQKGPCAQGPWRPQILQACKPQFFTQRDYVKVIT